MREKMGKASPKGPPQLEHGYTRIAHQLLEAIAAHEMAGRVKSAFLLVLRGTYGLPGSPKAAEFRISEMAGALKMDERVLRRELHRLETAKMLVIEKVLGGNGRLVRGTWRLAPQKDSTTWRPWADVLADERGQRDCRAQRDRQLNLFSPAPRTHLGCPMNAPPLSDERTLVAPWTHLGCPERGHNVSSGKDLRPPKTEDRKTVRPDVVPPACTPATPPERPSGSFRASSEEKDAVAPPVAAPPPSARPPFEGFFEGERQRAAAERRMRIHLGAAPGEDDLQHVAGEVAARLQAEAAAYVTKNGGNARAVANKILAQRSRVRAHGLAANAQAGEARARAEARPEEVPRPPEGPPRGGAPRPAAAPSTATPPRLGTVQVRGANGCLVERHRPAAALGDVLGDLLGGLGLGRAA